MPITHTFVSAKSDAGDATLLRPSDWNANHIGGLLAVVGYRPGSDSTIGSTSSNTLGDIDATNAIITFTAPTSGKVLVRLSCTLEGGGSLSRLGLRESTTTIEESIAFSSTDSDSNRSVPFYLTGISGGSHTYKAAFRTNSSTLSVIGGPSFGSLVLEVWDAT